MSGDNRSGDNRSGDGSTTEHQTATTVVSGEGGASEPRIIDLDPTSISSPDFDRYDVGAVLGKGGMGEVRVCRDRGIGRRVAMKVLRQRYSEREGFQTRFLREARVQGQLEHPCIVPVYEVGLTPDGEPYFTMKRVRGTTLRRVLRGLKAGDPQIESTYSRRKLLTALSTVCLAVDAAHRAGVVHATSNPRTSCSATSVRSTCSTGGSRRSRARRTRRASRSRIPAATD